MRSIQSELALQQLKESHQEALQQLHIQLETQVPVLLAARWYRFWPSRTSDFSPSCPSDELLRATAGHDEAEHGGGEEGHLPGLQGEPNQNQNQRSSCC